MNNTVLRILQILEEETDSEHALTKAEILQRLEDEGYESINEKQFYRKIEELKENKYPVEICKGRRTYYYLRRDRLNKEEWVYLLTLLLADNDLSERETYHILTCLQSGNISCFCRDIADEVEGKLSPHKSKIGSLGNFRVILHAMEKKCGVEYTFFSEQNGEKEFSERRKMIPLDYTAEGHKIVIFAEEDGEQKKLYLKNLIDVELAYLENGSK